MDKKIHIVSNQNKLLSEPNTNAPSISIASETPVIVLTWGIPDPAGETETIDVFQGPIISTYDLVKVVETGHIGYIQRKEWSTDRNIWGI